jgi:hypothetical protein
VKKVILFGSVFLLLIVGSIFSFSSMAWWRGGHRVCTQAALAALPADMPEFFRKGATQLEEMSHQPDAWKSLTASHLRSTEHPEHFIDLEYVDDKRYPQTRAEWVKLLADKKLDPYKVGTLPYALVENYERLMLAFREHRDHPDSITTQQRVLIYAGWLAHYCQDAGMPLHTTKDYDGRLPIADEKVAQKGIHNRMDSYPEKNNFTVELLSEALTADDKVDVWPMIVKFIAESHTKVDQSYELDKDGAFGLSPEKGREFILMCAKRSTQLTLDLWYSAWKNSDPKRATIK